MRVFRRQKSVSSLSFCDDVSDSASIASRASRRNGPWELSLPKDLEEVAKSQHGNLPQNLPGENASQEEVRYYFYSVLTCKDNNSAKLYPQWVLETCMSWEGDGRKLRSLSNEELHILCPLRAGFAEINPSKKHKITGLPSPVARHCIGAAIARAVTTCKKEENRLSGIERDKTFFRRSSRCYESSEDWLRQINGLQLSDSPQIHPLVPPTGFPDPRTAQARSNSAANRIFSPNLPNVNESHQETDYFSQQNAAATPLIPPTAAEYFQSLDACSTISPGSSNDHPVASILSQESKATSQTSFGVETTPTRPLSPKVDPPSLCTSPELLAQKPSTTCFVHKETLAKLEGRNISDGRKSLISSCSTKPRRYRPSSSIRRLFPSMLSSPSKPHDESSTSTTRYQQSCTSESDDTYSYGTQSALGYINASGTSIGADRPEYDTLHGLYAQPLPGMYQQAPSRYHQSSNVYKQGPSLYAYDGNASSIPTYRSHNPKLQQHQPQQQQWANAHPFFRTPTWSTPTSLLSRSQTLHRHPTLSRAASTTSMRPPNSQRVDSLALDPSDPTTWKARGQRPRGGNMLGGGQIPGMTLFETIEERERMDGKPQRGLDVNLVRDWKRYH